MTRRRTGALFTLGVLAGLGASELLRRTPYRAGGGGESTLEPTAAPAAPNRVGEQTRWIGVGGGPSPALNQVSLEQDMLLAREVLGAAQGVVLFAGGSGSDGVQVTQGRRDGDPLLDELGALFAPRGGRDARYHRTRVLDAGPATREAVTEVIRSAAGLPGPQLTLYIGGHGERGPEARDHRVALWGDAALHVDELAALLDAEAQRPVLLVLTTCYGGGFADYLYRGADPKEGPATPLRCGLFATTEDLPASGCDPNPDRAAQEGYALHFFNALRGQDRHGALLHGTPEDPDADGDGRVSFLEAHTHARLASSAADIPTSTSEAWLLHAAPATAEVSEVPLPEEDRFIERMAQRLGLRAEASALAARLDPLRARIGELEERLLAAQDEEDAAYRRLSAALWARWPVLDDPWHPDFGPLLARSREPIARFLAASPLAQAFRQATAATAELDGEIWALRAQAAPAERLARALATRDRARRLARLGGSAWTTYRNLLACERGEAGAGRLQREIRR